jgi:hypothetical protein
MWTKERVEVLSITEIQSLLANAKERNRQDVIETCNEVMSMRRTMEKPRRSRPSIANPRKELEKQLDERLVEVQKELEEVYDLSPSTARALSIGVKNFKPHNQLSSTGRSKTGAHQTRAAKVSLDRYISYRIKDSACALSCVQLDEYGRSLEFHVMGPSILLNNGYKHFRELRPYLSEDDGLGSYEGGEIFHEFEVAAKRYKWLIGQVAPQKEQRGKQ